MKCTKSAPSQPHLYHTPYTHFFEILVWYLSCSPPFPIRVRKNIEKYKLYSWTTYTNIKYFQTVEIRGWGVGGPCTKNENLGYFDLRQIQVTANYLKQNPVGTVDKELGPNPCFTTVLL